MIDSSAHVLVADDSLTIATALSLSLRRAGLQVTTTHSAEEALELACRTQFDLIISDQQMLAMSGTELCRQLRDRPNYRETPFILLTARSELEVEDGIGLTQVCTKPFSPKKLVALATSYLSPSSLPATAAKDPNAGLR